MPSEAPQPSEVPGRMDPTDRQTDPPGGPDPTGNPPKAGQPVSAGKPDLPGGQMDPADGPSPAARAANWAARIMTVSLEMVIPGLAGYWVDNQLGTRVLFMLIGFVLGCSAATVHLIHLVGRNEKSGDQ